VHVANAANSFAQIQMGLHPDSHGPVDLLIN